MVQETTVKPVQSFWWDAQKEALGILIRPATRPVTRNVELSSRALIIQIGVWALVAAGSDLVDHWLHPTRILTNQGSKLVYAVASVQLQNAVEGLSLSVLLLLPLVFFIDTRIIYALARRAQGAGTFRAQSSAMVLLLMPLGLVNSLLQFVPVLSSITAIVFFIYGLVLQVKVVRELHQFPTGQSVGMVLLPLVLFLVLSCMLTVTLGVLLVQMLR